MAKTLDEWVELIGQLNKEKGWDFETKDLPEKFMLMVTEISEAMEEYRVGRSPTEIHFSGNPSKPEGISVELVDVVIRIMHFFAKYRLSMDQVMEMKFEYNRTRPFRHGNKIA